MYPWVYVTPVMLIKEKKKKKACHTTLRQCSPAFWCNKDRIFFQRKGMTKQANLCCVSGK